MRLSSVSMLAIALAGFAAIPTSILAANLPVKAPPAPPPIVMFTWSGFYFGAHVGYGISDVDTRTDHLPSQAAFVADPFNQSTRAKGVLGGVQAGYNWQSGSLVYGFEVDYSKTRVKGDSVYGPLPLFGGALDPGSSQTFATEVDWLATARLRYGSIVADRTLLYLTGGLAMGRVDHAITTDYVGDAFRYPGTQSKTKTGWTVGGGLEMAFSAGWSMKAEYLYFDLGNDEIQANPVAANPPFVVRTDHEVAGHIFRLGMNYRFGG